MNPDVHTVTVFNAGTTPPTKLAEIPVGYDPESVAINPSSPKAYVANAFSGTISVIDLNALFVTNTIAVGAEPMGVAVSPNGTRLYVANSASNSVSVINTSTETVIATIDVSAFGTAPRALAITNNGDGNDNDETILVALFFAQLRAGKTSAEGGAGRSARRARRLDLRRHQHRPRLDTPRADGERPRTADWGWDSTPTASSPPQ